MTTRSTWPEPSALTSESSIIAATSNLLQKRFLQLYWSLSRRPYQKKIPVDCLANCYSSTTIQDVADALDDIAKEAQFSTCEAQCANFPVGSQEINDCTVDCYVNLAPEKFPITAATQAEIDEMTLDVGGPEKK